MAIQKVLKKDLAVNKIVNSNATEPETDKPIEEPQNIRREKNEIDESNVNFSQSRDLWQRRANIEAASSPLIKAQRLSEPFVHRQSHTPDLVMDLPLASSVSVFSNLCLTSSPEDTTNNTEKPTQEVESPEMTTAAETFAKQNQCTLKKNTKIQIESSEFMTITSPVPNRKYATIGAATSTSTFKPPTKVKPMVLKKPVFTVPLRSMSIEMVCNKDSELPP